MPAAIVVAITSATITAANSHKAGDWTLVHLNLLELAFQPQQQLEKVFRVPTQLHHPGRP